LHMVGRHACWLPQAVLLTLVHIAFGAGSQAGHQVSFLAAGTGHAPEKSKSKPPADSKTIDGPDCGHVKQIIGKWQKASKVGKLAGSAQGAVMAASAAASAAEAGAKKARELGKEIDKDGKVPDVIESVAKKAEEAGKKATKESTELETELKSFKSTVSGSEISGSDVKDKDMVKLRELTEKVIVATKDAKEAGGDAMDRAEAAKKDALEDSAKAVKMIQSRVDKSSSVLKEAKSASEKANTAVGDAEHKVKGVESTVKDLEKKEKDAGDQAPVWKALKTNLDDTAKAVTEAAKPVKEFDIKTPIDALDKAIAPLESASKKAAAGAVIPSVSKDLDTARAAEDDLKLALEKLKAKVKTLKSRESRMDSKLEEAEKKLEKKKK